MGSQGQAPTAAHPPLLLQAILSKQRAETLSSVLYPDDRTYEGKELRLKQQHFFVSATVQVGGRGVGGAGHSVQAVSAAAAWPPAAACTHLQSDRTLLTLGSWVAARRMWCGASARSTATGKSSRRRWPSS